MKAVSKPRQQPGADNGRSYVFAAEMVPQGGGAVLVRPGKPVERLTPKAFAAVFGVDRDSVYRWRSEGLIRAEFIEAAGRRKFLIRAEAVEALRKQFGEAMETR